MNDYIKKMRKKERMDKIKKIIFGDASQFITGFSACLIIFIIFLI